MVAKKPRRLAVDANSGGSPLIGQRAALAASKASTPHAAWPLSPGAGRRQRASQQSKSRSEMATRRGPILITAGPVPSASRRSKLRRLSVARRAASCLVISCIWRSLTFCASRGARLATPRNSPIKWRTSDNFVDLFRGLVAISPKPAVFVAEGVLERLLASR